MSIDAAIQKSVCLDISNIFARYYQENSQLPTYKQFESFWIQHNFSYLHYCCLVPEQRPFFMQLLFGTLLSHLNEDSASCCLIIYSLFLIFKTQPSIWKREKIFITCRQWDLIVFNLRRMQQLTDLVACFDELVGEEEAFEFVASSDLASEDEMSNLLIDL